MTKNRIITVQDIPITVSETDIEDYICITDLAVAKSNSSRAADVIKNWLRNRNTLEFLGTWEEIYNPGFKVVEFDHFKSEAGLHTFVLSVSEWIEKTNAIGIVVTVLSNLETHNAQMIREGKSKEIRFEILQEIAEYQLNILNEAQSIHDKIGACL